MPQKVSENFKKIYSHTKIALSAFYFAKFTAIMEVAIRAIHEHSAATARRLALAAAGAGSSGISALLAVSGASATVVDAAVPYGKAAFDAFSGCRLEKYVSPEAAVRLGSAAYARATSFCCAGEIPAGAAVTSAVSSISARRGESLSFGAAVSSDAIHLLAVRLDKMSGRSRAMEEELCGRVLVTTAALAQQVPSPALETCAAALPPLHVGGAGFSTAPERDGSDSASAFDPRSALTLPVDTVLHWRFSLSDPLERLLTAAAQRVAAHSSSSSPGDSASQKSSHAVMPLSKAVESWLPPVTHVLYSLEQRGSTHVPGSAPGSATPTSADSEPASSPCFVNPPLTSDAAASAVAALAPRPGSIASCAAQGALPLPTVLLVPGSFNPLHEGHARMAAAAQRALQRLWAQRLAAAGSSRQPPLPRIVFELSAANVDKPPLAAADVRRRVAQFATVNAMMGLSLRADTEAGSSGEPGGPAGSTAASPASPAAARAEIVVTSAPRFVDKAALFPGCAFVVGWDTAARLIEPKYYAPPTPVAPASASALASASASACASGGAGAPSVSPAGGATAHDHGDGDTLDLPLTAQDAMVEALLAMKLAGTVIFVAGRVASAAPATAAAALGAAAGASAAPVAGAASGSVGGSDSAASADPDRFLTLADLAPRIPPLLRGLFKAIPEEDFRADVSSTELRKKAQAQAQAQAQTGASVSGSSAVAGGARGTA